MQEQDIMLMVIIGADLVSLWEEASAEMCCIQEGMSLYSGHT